MNELRLDPLLNNECKWLERKQLFTRDHELMLQIVGFDISDHKSERDPSGGHDSADDILLCFGHNITSLLNSWGTRPESNFFIIIISILFLQFSNLDSALGPSAFGLC